MRSSVPSMLHALSVILAFTPGALAAQEPPRPKAGGPAGTGREAGEAPHAYFQRAWHYETAEGKGEEALAMYRGLAELPDVPDALRAKALYRAAICLRKLQRPEEARDALRRITKEFPDVVEVAQAAERELGEESLADSIIRRKVDEILVELWTANRNSQGNQPSTFLKLVSDLDAIGPRAAPYILDVLAAAEPHPASDHLAAALTRFAAGDAGAAAAVRRLLREGRPDLRRMLLDAHGWGKSDAWRDLIVELAADGDAGVRAAAVEALRPYDDPAARDAVLARVEDPDPAVRIAAAGELGLRVAGPDDLAGLRALYADPDADVRAAAVAAVEGGLERAGGPTEVDLSPEVALLADPSGDVLAALVDLFGSAPGGLPDGAIEPLARRVSELRGLDAAAAQPGRAVMPRPPGRHPFDVAVRLLAGTRDARALPVYITVLEENREPLLAEALEAIAAIGDTAAVPALLGLLVAEPDPPPALRPGVPRAPPRRAGISANRQRAFRILTQELWGQQALEALAERISDLPRDMQLSALDRILAEGTEEIAAGVFARYASLSPDARYRAVLHPALLRAAPALAREVIEAALADEEEAVRLEALKTVRNRFLDPEWTPALAAAYTDSSRRSMRKACEEILAVLGSLADPRGIDVFLAALASDALGLAKRASEAFPDRWAGETQAIERLAALLAPGAAFHPGETARLLARIARREDAPRLARALGEAVPEVRAALAGGLARLGGKEALDPLLEAAADPQADVQSAALDGLASLSRETLRSSPRVVEVAAKVVAEGEEPAQLRAIAVLARHESAAATAALESALASPSEGVQREAAAALAALGDASCVPALARFLDGTENLEVIVEIAGVLGALRDPRAIEPLVRRLGAVASKENSAGASQAANRIIDALSKHPPAPVVAAVLPLLDESASVPARARFLSLLSRFDDPRAVEVLRRHISHEDPDLRRLAVEAAGARLDREALPALLERLRDASPAVRKEAQSSIERIRFYESERRLAGLGEPADRALEELLALLEANEPAVRASAARALGRIGGARALRALVRRRNDPDEAARAAVEKALDEIAAREERP